MAPIPLNITDEQRFALIKFRSSVRDTLKPGHDDHFLLRWLRARSWNPENAEKMLRESLKWRDHWKVDELEEWEAPEIFSKYYPSGVSGFDKDGSPVIVVPFSGLDMWGMIHSATRSDFVRYTLLTLERYLKLSYKQSEVHGIKARQLVAIIDMEGFSMKQYVWRPAAELIVALINMYESNYPEILKSCYVINVNRVFYIAFALVKKFLNEDTLSKIHIFKGDKKKYLPAILSNIEADQIPKYIGGTQVDENGDERCTSKIRQGGKVPNSCYYRKPDKSGQKSDFTVSEVKKGTKLTLDFEATANSILRYEIKNEGPDIKFSIERSDAEGTVEEIEPRKIDSSTGYEIGVLTHDKATTYKVTFDNDSFLRNAKVHHLLQVLPPLTSTPMNKE